MGWPSITDFSSAIQTPGLAFYDHDLSTGELSVYDGGRRSGMPIVSAGNFAAVYRVSTKGRSYAVRCFTRTVNDQRDRYSQLDAYLKHTHPPAFVGFEFLQEGIRVRGNWYPIVKMEWVNGVRMNQFVQSNLQAPDTLRNIAARWRGLVSSLQSLYIAHNDLQHGNVMVQEDHSLRLVDYDAMYLPQYLGRASPENGHPNFQHPLKTTQNYDQQVDNFPSLVIYLSLLALAADPELWNEFYNDDNLLFTKADYRNPTNSKCFRALKGSHDKTVRYLTAYLEQWCACAVDAVPNLENILSMHLGIPSPPSTPVPAPARPTAPFPAPPSAAPARNNQAKATYCPKCKSQNARLRRDWYTRTSPFRCLSCNGVFGKILVKRCPGCGSQNARLRRDWYHRARPLRCRDCNAVFGGTDERAPGNPVVGKTSNLNRLVDEVARLQIEHDTLVDRSRGLMIGIATGNLLGLPVEGQSHHRIEAQYPGGIRDIDPRETSRRVDDDPAQAIELAEALLDTSDTISAFAKRLVAWRSVNGRGLGRTTRQSIIQLADGMESPHAAYAVYQAKGGIDPNGGIMRCAPVAAYYRTQSELLTQMSADTCAVTHYSPLSQWSCVIVNVAIAMLLGSYEPDLQKLLAAAEADGCPDLLAAGRKAGIDTTVLERAIADRAAPEGTSWLRDNQAAKGHTVLTLQVGLWAATTQPGLRRLAAGGSECRRRLRHERRTGGSGAGSAPRRSGHTAALDGVHRTERAFGRSWQTSVDWLGEHEICRSGFTTRGKSRFAL